MLEAIDQVIGVFADRDAVGCHTMEVQRACRALGLRSEIYAGSVDAGNGHPCRPLDDLPPDDGRRLLLYQASSASPAADFVLARTEPFAVNYHNVTPATFFAPWEPTVTAELRAARAQVRRLGSRAVSGVADSAFNAAELHRMRYQRVDVVPVLLDLDRFTAGEVGSRRPGGARWLFVGRLSPNKTQHHLVAALAVHRRLYDAEATLTLVGRSSSHAYETALHRYVRDLGLDRVVTFVGSVSDDDLRAHYRDADVYVCLSEHEGFCNTVVEAMASGLPVVAFGAAALPETVGDGGLMLDRKDPPYVAAAVQRVLTDERVRDALVAGGRRRAAALSLPHAREQLAAVLRDLGAAA